MKINTNFDALVLSKKENVSQDGRKFFQITIFVPSSGEAGQIGCSDKVFAEIKEQKNYNFSAEYNDAYKSFRITGVK